MIAKTSMCKRSLSYTILTVRYKLTISMAKFSLHCSNFYDFNQKLIYVLGNVWVFTIYPPNITDSSNEEYCEAGLYYFSFALIIAAYAWLVFTLFCSGCVAACGIKEVAAHASRIVTTKGGETSGTAEDGQ